MLRHHLPLNMCQYNRPWTKAASTRKTSSVMIIVINTTLLPLQTTGLGGMKPNTVVVGWPNNWRKREDDGTRVSIADYVVVVDSCDDDDQSSPLFISVTNLSMKYIQDFWGKGDFVIILVPGVCEYHTSSSGRWAFAFNDEIFFWHLVSFFPFYCLNIFFLDFLIHFHFTLTVSHISLSLFFLHFLWFSKRCSHFFGGCSWLDQKDSAPAKVFLSQITENASNDKQDVKI